MENNEAFLGRGWSFPPEFFSGGAEVSMVSDEEDIRQSLHILLSTALGERTMFSTFGCDLLRYLFEEMDRGLANSISGIVSDAILLHEPRVQAERVEVSQAASDTGLLLIAVDYTIRATNNRYNLVYPFYINEASNMAS